MACASCPPGFATLAPAGPATASQGGVQDQGLIAEPGFAGMDAKAVIETYDNGFVGLWLLRGIDATLTISTDGKSAMGEISTKNAGEATCVTTLQLS